MLIRLNQIMRGWANYFKHAVAKHTFSNLDNFTWWRLDPHAAGTAPLEVGTSAAGSPPPTGGGYRSRRTGSSTSGIEAVPVTRYRYRGNKIPNPWPPSNPA